MSNTELILNKCGSLVVFFSVPFISCWLPLIIPVPPYLLHLGILYSGGLFFSLAVEHILAESVVAFEGLITDVEHILVAFEGRITDVGPFPYVVFVAGYMLTWLSDLLTAGGEGIGEMGGVEMGRRGGGEEWLPISSGKPKGRLSIAEVLPLMFALCFHSLFEGLAIGLTATFSDFWDTTLTVVIHKIFEGLALGTTLRSQNSRRSCCAFLSYAASFSGMVPLGIVAGVVLDSSASGTVTLWMDAVGNALAAGVFVYVATVHLISKAMQEQSSLSPQSRPSSQLSCCARGAGPVLEGGKGDVHKRPSWWLPFVRWGATVLGVATNTLLQLKHFF
ncbi:unnamed protein product [Closterium sp. Yama58-4]|nr:unnamed protein product [Closterium sp. Yama58-4]